MPKVGSTVKSPDGEGVVVSNNMLKMISKIKIPQGEGEVYKDFAVTDLKFDKFKPHCDKCRKGRDEDVTEDEEAALKNILD